MERASLVIDTPVPFQDTDHQQNYFHLKCSDNTDYECPCCRNSSMGILLENNAIFDNLHTNEKYSHRRLEAIVPAEASEGLTSYGRAHWNISLQAGDVTVQHSSPDYRNFNGISDLEALEENKIMQPTIETLGKHPARKVYYSTKATPNIKMCLLPSQHDVSGGIQKTLCRRQHKCSSVADHCCHTTSQLTRGNPVTILKTMSELHFGLTIGALYRILVVLALLLAGCSATASNDDLLHQEVEGWATTMGNHLSTLVDTVTKFKEIQTGYESHRASVRLIDGVALVKEMSHDVRNMMGYKLQAVRRIMNVAEESFKDSASKGHGGDNVALRYVNAKKINLRYKPTHKKAGELVPFAVEINLTANSHFDDMEVNTRMSSIHVPTNVFDRSPEVLNAIRWSDTLDRTFVSNYELDPTLHWQYFGSSVGFLRQYPASAWTMDEKDPDLYDARLRSWYIRAANTPKDMIILLDVSGSMTGLRQEIARHVVINILDTLNDNDFVNIFNFSSTTDALVPCFNETLVQANLENIGEFKQSLSKIKTEQIANFSQALTKAFSLLAKHNENGQGSQCNQVIMLVTDGSPYQHEEIFQEFNWPQRQVRLFTYLIGREMNELKNLLWMACANKGYFVHVSTLAEVREQVLKYIPVIARPLVMTRDKHPHIWTGVYADVASPYDSRKILKIAARPEKVFGRRNKQGNKSGYKLMTSVAVPVFDLNETSVKTANLLGVAGADVPIEEIQKLVPPYKLGANGYSFIVNQNGHILFHPDLRPVHEESNAEFQDILKPNYNSIDLSEVELIAGAGEEQDEPRYNNSELMELRQKMINQQAAYCDLTVKVHSDGMKRVVVRKQEYHAAPIEGTPFSLGIALPSASPRPYEVAGEIEISRFQGNVTSFFHNEFWNVHPEWVYCEYKYEQPSLAPYTKSPEALLVHFLDKTQQPGWRWSSTRTNQPPDSTSENCDKELIQALLFDAQVTDVYNKSINDSINIINKDYFTRSGINTAFVATRSGLTRWQDTPDKPPTDSAEPHFIQKNNKAIDEIWYKRAVDYYFQDPEAYVYSVPFDAGTRNPSEVLMTASRAVFIRKTDHIVAPAAVVGVTITLEKFIDYFKNETKKCSSPGCKKEKLCSGPDHDCYLVDDNGFIVASERTETTGRFFGEIEGTIMNYLVMNEVYNKVKVYDYQAVCLESVSKGSIASILSTPIEAVKWFIRWLAGNFVWLMVKTQLYQMWDLNEAWAYTHGTGLNQQYPDTLDFDGQLPPLPLPSDAPPEFEEQGGGTVIAPEVHQPLVLDKEVYSARTRRGVKTVVEIVKSDDTASDYGKTDEVPYDIASDYESVIANVSLNEDKRDFFNVTVNEGHAPAVDYEELLTATISDDDDDDRHRGRVKAVEYDDDEHTIGYEYDESTDDLEQPTEMEEFPKLELAMINKTRPRPCDKEVTLYNLNLQRLKDSTGSYTAVRLNLSNCHANGCGRPFSVQKIMKTNLVLIVVNNRCPCDSQTVGIEPREVEYNDSVHCENLLTSNYRKRPSDCYNYHPMEQEIKLCRGCSMGPSIVALASVFLFQLLVVHQ